MTWFVFPKPRPRAELRLLCFPYAGGSAISFNSWAAKISEHIEVGIVQLPGRENRSHEPFIKSVGALIPEIGAALRRLDARPFALFGHSVGAVLAYELTRWLEAREAVVPIHLTVAGRSAPHLPRPERALHKLPDVDLIAKLRSFNGTPRVLLENQEIMDFFLPRLRADFELNETYTHIAGPRVRCPITALGGETDSLAPADELGAWKDLGSAQFSSRSFSGDHFFVHQRESDVLRLMESTIMPSRMALS
jgi:surfactin synthase thioesterase subunit